MKCGDTYTVRLNPPAQSSPPVSSPPPTAECGHIDSVIQQTSVQEIAGKYYLTFYFTQNAQTPTFSLVMNYQQFGVLSGTPDSGQVVIATGVGSNMAVAEVHPNLNVFHAGGPILRYRGSLYDDCGLGHFISG